MQAFHLLGSAPFYTNSFLLLTKAGHAVIIDPAAEVQEYDKILRDHGAVLTHILCTHGHYDHVGSAGVLSREWGAKIWCEAADCAGTQLFPLKSADFGYEEGANLSVDELTFTAWHTPALSSCWASATPIRWTACPNWPKSARACASSRMRTTS